MAPLEAQADAFSLGDGSRSATSAPAPFRFRLSRLFEALTYAAIVGWAARASSTVYEVYGLVPSGFVWAVAGIGVLASVPLLFLFRLRNIVRIWMIVFVAFAVVQSTYARRLTALRTEVAGIIDYLYDHKLKYGLYPTDLSEYQFRRPDLAEYIEYRDAFPTTSYEIRWHPIHLDGIAHWYGADYGDYYEDD